MKQTPTFNQSTIASTASKINVEAFDASVDAFDNKRYTESFLSLLDYINPELRRKYGNSDNTEFSIPHGSIIVNISLKNNQLKVTAPFLALPESNKIPLLRQIAVLNFYNLNLGQIDLKEDQLQFEYSCPMALVDPYKIYNVLREICVTGDKYDDEFSTKFGAQRIYEPKITPYDSQTIDTVYNVIQQSCNECLAALKDFESERKYGNAWNIVAITLLKILYFAHPQGQLLNDLNKAVYDLDRENIQLPEIVSDGKKVVERIQKMSKIEIAEDLYFVDTFVPNKRRSSLKNIQENFEKPFKKISDSYEQENYMAACIMAIYNFYDMYFYNNLQDDVNSLVVKALQDSSAKSWDVAAPILYQAMKNIMQGNLNVSGSSSSKSKGGLFGFFRRKG